MALDRPHAASTALALLPLVALLVGPASAQAPGTVLSEQKISSLAGGFGGALADGDSFGRSMASLGDLDGDGNGDLAVGANLDDDGGTSRGAVWILFLDEDGTVLDETKISSSSGGLTGPLGNSDQFGVSVTNLGDLDGDGVTDLAVGASLDDDGGTNRGAVYILFLNADGTVKAEAKISATVGGLAGALQDGDRFGASVAGLDDLDGDGVEDLAVGADQDDDGGPNRGAVWVLFLNADGTVKGEQKISDTAGNFGGVLDDDDRFGISAAALGDLDGDGNMELAVGADQDDDGGNNRGAAWIVFLADNGNAALQVKLSASSGIALDDSDRFGASVGAAGDVDDDGLPDLAVGAIGDDDGSNNRGAVWIVYMLANGTIGGWQKISATTGGFGGALSTGDLMGISVTGLGDHDGDGFDDLAMGAIGDDDGGPERGAAWVSFLRGCSLATVASRNGTGVNAMLLTAGPPSFGATWDVTIDASGHAPGLAGHVAVAAPLNPGFVFGAGELLIDLSSALLSNRVIAHSGQAELIKYSIPLDTSFCGLAGYSQAYIGGSPGVELTNALDFTAGR